MGWVTGMCGLCKWTREPFFKIFIFTKDTLSPGPNCTPVTHTPTETKKHLPTTAPRDTLPPTGPGAQAGQDTMTNESSTTQEHTLAHIELQPFIGGNSATPLVQGMPEFLKPTKTPQSQKTQLDPNPPSLPDWLSAPDPVYTPSKDN